MDYSKQCLWSKRLPIMKHWGGMPLYTLWVAILGGGPILINYPILVYVCMNRVS
jgi:hypothetical protein